MPSARQAWSKPLPRRPLRPARRQPEPRQRERGQRPEARPRAFRCAPADCGVEVTLYLRAKIGFCNCTAGVADDTELDRVGDVSLLSDRFVGLRESSVVHVGWMDGRSRVYDVTPIYGPRQPALAIAFNDKCDVIVATVVAGKEISAETERAALAFLNSDVVLRWARAELGV